RPHNHRLQMDSVPHRDHHFFQLESRPRLRNASGRENKEDKERDSAQDDFSWDKEVESAGIVIHRGATENTFFGAVASLFNYPQIDPPRMPHYTCRFPHPNLDKRSSPCALL